MDRIRAIVYEPGKPGEVRVISKRLESFQAIVGGYIEELPLTIKGKPYLLICNEEGKLLGLPINRPVPCDMIVGTFLVCHATPEGTYTSLSDVDIADIRDYFEHL